MTPAYTTPIQWQQNVGYARDICARLFRDGGAPADALRSFGLVSDGPVTWSVAVERIASALSQPKGHTARLRLAA